MPATATLPKLLSTSAAVSLTTERLFLRPPVPSDAARIAALVTPEISRWMASWPAPCTVDFAADRIEKARGALEAGRALPLVVVDKETGELVGMVEAFLSRDDPGRVTLGFWMGGAWHGRGLMTEAVGAAIAHLAQDPCVRVIDGGAQLANAGSKAVMRKLGMKSVGTRMVYANARDVEEPCEFFEIDRAALRRQAAG